MRWTLPATTVTKILIVSRLPLSKGRIALERALSYRPEQSPTLKHFKGLAQHQPLPERLLSQDGKFLGKLLGGANR